MDKIYNNIYAEKLHVKFCKHIFGTHKKSCKLAVLSELGRFPIHFDIVKCLLKFWHRLENLGTSFPHEAYMTSKNLSENRKKIMVWKY